MNKRSSATAVEARGLGRRYGGNWALSGCTLDIPAGGITGLVGPNGAGKTTLLKLTAGLLRPTTGTITVMGGIPGSGSAQLRKVGFVAQETPLYAGLSVADHLRLGARMNSTWDAGLARDRVSQLGLDPRRKAGKLSGGQRAQLALTLAMARRPELLVLDEPVASLDPLARREFLHGLTQAASQRAMSAILSSHLVSDLEHACDFLIVLVASQVQIAAQVKDLLADHHLLTELGPGTGPALAGPAVIVAQTRAAGRTTLLVRAYDGPIAPEPGWDLSQPSLEDIVLAYLSAAGSDSVADPRRGLLEETR
jgi:ABC-2 type transport system ATP-binding protein